MLAVTLQHGKGLACHYYNIIIIIIIIFQLLIIQYIIILFNKSNFHFWVNLGECGDFMST